VCAPCRCWPGENIGSRFVVPTVAGCVDIVVHLVTEPDGSRRVREIVAVPGRVEGDVVELEPIFAVRRLLEYCESP
jgi:pilus assembly protein CpaF